MTNDAEPFLSALGDCQSTPTCDNSTPQPTEASLFSPEGHHASRRVEPGSKEARKMCAGSGRKQFALYRKPGPIGSFLKILLESETWGSTEYLMDWKHSATKSRRRLIFRLVPLIPRSSDIGSGLWATPTANPAPRGRQGQFSSGHTKPQSRDVKGQTQNAHRMDAVPNVILSTWPTPRLNTGPSEDAKHLSVDGCLRGANTFGCLAQMESFVARLTNLSMWLMGYTAAYLVLWETASSCKSPRKSSKPSPQQSD